PAMAGIANATTMNAAKTAIKSLFILFPPKERIFGSRSNENSYQYSHSKSHPFVSPFTPLRLKLSCPEIGKPPNKPHATTYFGTNALRLYIFFLRMSRYFVVLCIYFLDKRRWVLFAECKRLA
ncbi:MAG: hypothetical protein DRG71_08895, partial [Deltaproteobacteria bacterium]